TRTDRRVPTAGGARGGALSLVFRRITEAARGVAPEGNAGAGRFSKHAARPVTAASGGPGSRGGALLSAPRAVPRPPGGNRLALGRQGHRGRLAQGAHGAGQQGRGVLRSPLCPARARPRPVVRAG